MTTAGEWSGKVGSVWAAEWPRTDRSFAELSRVLDAAILDAAPPATATGRTAFDIGCGAGITSIALASARADLDVVGLDIAPDLVAIAGTRAAGLANACFRVADLNDGVPATPPPALIVSRHGVMFFDDPIGVFSALARAAAPDATLVFSCFRAPSLNPWAADLVAEVTGTAPVVSPPTADRYRPGPFAFADRAYVADLLSAAGWRDPRAEQVDYRYVAGAGDDPVADAVSFFQRIGPVAAALREADAADRPRLLDKLGAALHKRCDHDEVAFPAAAWIWRAHLPGDRA